MTSAIAFLANATATFTVPTAGTVTESATGNVVPATETVTVTLYLRSSGGTAPRLSEFPGVGVEDDTLEGYAVSPQALDARINAGTPGTIVFAGEPSCACEVADPRHPFGSTGYLGETLQGILGDKIRISRFKQR